MTAQAYSTGANTRKTDHAITAPTIRIVVVGAPELASAVRSVAHGSEAVPVDHLALAVGAAEAHRVDAALIDVTDAIRAECVDAIRSLRAEGVGVVVLTEPSDAETRVRAIALDAEAATRPVTTNEVAARLQAVVRRRVSPGLTTARVLGDFTFDPVTRTVERRRRTSVLTKTEADVLQALLARRGAVVSKQELLDVVWGSNRNINAVEAQVSSLRRKLAEIGPPLITTVHGQGYILRPPAAADTMTDDPIMTERERRLRDREEAVSQRAKLLRELERRQFGSPRN